MNQGVVLGAFLFTTMLVVHFSTQRRPLDSRRPLDIDKGLPAPWAGYASSTLSLTALFAAFLGVFLLLGWPAIAGVALGIVTGLFAIRGAILRASAESFDAFLRSRRFTGTNSVHLILWTFFALSQLGFASSELILFHEISMRGLGLAPRHATALALSIALIVYFYCLIGGYDAVFRTDIIKLIGLLGMCVWMAYLALLPIDQAPAALDLKESQKFWALSLNLPPWIRVTLNSIVGFSIGITGIAGTPDTWKRVFIAVQRGKRHNSFAILILAGCLPFLFIGPIILRAGERSQSLPLDFLFTLSQSTSFSLALLIGMTSAFMSSFDSAIVAATHLLVTRPPGRKLSLAGIDMYRAVLCACFAVVVFICLAVFNRAGNPYLVGNSLMGPFCTLAGLILGTSFLEKPSHGRIIFLLSAILFMGWTLYFSYLVHNKGLAETASIGQVETMPLGAGIFLLCAVVARLARE